MFLKIKKLMGGLPEFILFFHGASNPIQFDTLSADGPDPNRKFSLTRNIHLATDFAIK